MGIEGWKLRFVFSFALYIGIYHFGRFVERKSFSFQNQAEIQVQSFELGKKFGHKEAADRMRCLIKPTSEQIPHCRADRIFLGFPEDAK